MEKLALNRRNGLLTTDFVTENEKENYEHNCLKVFI